MRLAHSSAGTAVLFALALAAAPALAQDSLPGNPPEGPPAMPGLLGPPGTWHRLPIPQTVESARHGHSAIHDPAGGRVVEFGGIQTNGVRLNDLIELRVCGAPGWQTVATTGTAPTPRFGHTAIYDPIRHRMIVFGGEDGAPSAGLFALSLAGVPAWSALSPVGPAPGPRYGHNAIYDPLRDRMIVFGGFNGGAFLNEVWTLALAGAPVWTRLDPLPGAPVVRDYASAFYDPVRDRMIVFGGNNGAVFNDVWALGLSGAPAWTQLFPSGALPAPRLAHSALYDPAGDRMVMFGGVTSTQIYGDVWTLSLGGAPAWTLTDAILPPAHSRGAVYLPDFGRVMVHAGVQNGFSLAASQQIDLSPVVLARPLEFTQPAARDGQVLVLDPARRRFLLHGGERPALTGDLYEMPIDGPGVWGAPCLMGPVPSARYGHQMVYDPVRDRMWMHGGFNGQYLDDLWQLSLGTPMAWTPVAPAGPLPPGRDFASFVYDANRDRMVLFGGNQAGVFRNDVWVLDPGTPGWTALTPTGTPPTPRLAHRAVFDAVRDRMLVVAGFDTQGRNDVWALEFAPSPHWVQLFPGGTPPSGRHSASLILDTARDRLVLFGGYDGHSTNDLWELPLTGPFAWAPLATPETPFWRHGHAAVYDPFHDLMLMHSGFASQIENRLRETWVLNWGSHATPALLSLANSEVGVDRVRLVWQGPSDAGGVGTVLRREEGGAWQGLGTATSEGAGRWTYEDLAVTPGARYRYALDLGEGPQAEVDIEVPLRAAFEFAGLSPSPGGPGARLVFSLPAASRVRIDAFDVSGRRVASEDLGVLPAGTHRVHSGAIGRLAPGMYGLRLVTGAGVRTVRATIVR